jgi:hypothetical protein
MVDRVQRKRTKGYNAPPETIYVGRPSRWGNPFIVDDYTPSREECVRSFTSVRGQQLNESTEWFVDFYIKPLLGAKHLSCWCPADELCHADFWVALLNDYNLGNPLTPTPQQRTEEEQ